MFSSVVIAGVLLGCAADLGAQRRAAAQLEGDMGLLEPFRAISPREPVPHFMVMDTDGAVHDSRKLMGQGPLVVSFFASWCESCAVKAPMLKRSLQQAPRGTQALWVSLDDDSTWRNVSDYVERNQLESPVVRGAEFAKFALAYDPMQAVPAIVVVDLAGYVVDFQVGVRKTDAARLKSALDLAATRRPTPAGQGMGGTAPKNGAFATGGDAPFSVSLPAGGRVVFDGLAPRPRAQAVD